MSKKVNSQGSVLITGAAKRIGKAICFALASQGYNIALHYHRSKSQAEALAESIRSKGRACQLFCCDLSDEKQAYELITNVRKKFRNLNALINNASVFERSSIKSSSIVKLHRHFAVNFNAPYILTSQFARACKKGNIINILDTHIVDNKTRHADYLLSKKALFELTQLSAIELAPNIRVNAVAAGLILPSAQTKSDQLKRLAKKVPLKTKGHPDQIVQSILFLLDNPYLTGQVIFNDGGEHLV